MLLYRSENIMVNYLEIQYLTHILFYEKNFNIKKELNTFLDNMVKRKARHILWDLKRVENYISNDDILFIINEIIPQIASIKIENNAFLLTDNNLTLPSEITVKNKKIRNRIFDDPKEAMQWLLEGSQRKHFSFENGRKPSHKHHHNK